MCEKGLLIPPHTKLGIPIANVYSLFIIADVDVKCCVRIGLITAQKNIMKDHMVAFGLKDVLRVLLHVFNTNLVTTLSTK